MTVGQFLAENTKLLTDAGISTARLDCLILLEDALGYNRARILAHPEAKIAHRTEVELNKKIAQRGAHLPLAYIRGKVMFYGREFIVAPDVLVPRPESESIIALLKGLAITDGSTIVDIGTGSGCLGISAGLENPAAQVWLCDIDAKALEVAEGNAEKYNLGRDSIHLIESNLLEKTPKAFDILLANLPYVPDDYPINKAAGHEPSLALFAGEDGLDLYRKLWQQIALLPRKPSFAITESLVEQHVQLTSLAKKTGYILEATDGLAQCFRLNQLGQHQE